MGIIAKPIPELTIRHINRFWSKVAITANNDKCWNWTSYKNQLGYAIFGLDINKKTFKYQASRVSYFINNGHDLLGTEVILHICDNPACVNPKHLKSGTRKENAVDMMNKKRGGGQFPSGSKNKNSKLNEDSVLIIRSMLSNGVNKNDIAVKFNVSWRSIYEIEKGRSWKNVI